MFTLNEIKAAHSKVKTGADYPSYVQEIIKLGVVSYETFVNDNRTDYIGVDGMKAASKPFGEVLTIANQSDKETFLYDIKEHQHGKTDYQTFREDCAKSGVEKWVADLSRMTCTYFDISGNVLLVEQIPLV